MAKFVGRVSRYPARALFAWYLLLVAVGSVLLTRPAAVAPDVDRIAPLDAIFTATSAACVTGLVVRSTPHDFSLFGQIVIVVLIQLGGIGIMTIATFVAVSWSGRESVRHRITMAETLGAEATEDMRRLLKQVIFITLLFEAAGFAALFGRFLFDMPWQSAAGHALFHSVSAFCNAGFALYDDSLVAYQGDPVVNATIILLVVIGGIGFPVLRDLHRVLKLPRGVRWERLHLHTKLVICGTTGLLALGTVAVLLLEWNHALAEMSPQRSAVTAVFQSVTTRTAGFNTIDLSQLTNATLFIMLLLMFVGAGPGSTGGGFKVSTFVVLVLHAWSKLWGRSQIKVFRRAVSGEVVGRAIATVLLFAFLGTIALCLLLVVEDVGRGRSPLGMVFFDALFEVVSALGTVGLSTGYTEVLSGPGKCVIIVLMFAGRIGPVSLVAAFARRPRHERLQYPDEVVLIG